MRVLLRVLAVAGVLVVGGAIYFLQYNGRLGPAATARFIGGGKAKSVKCQRGWRVLPSRGLSYLFHWTYACRVEWNPGLGPPETLGVRVNTKRVTDSELG